MHGEMLYLVGSHLWDGIMDFRALFRRLDKLEMWIHPKMLLDRYAYQLRSSGEPELEK